MYKQNKKGSEALLFSKSGSRCTAAQDFVYPYNQTVRGFCSQFVRPYSHTLSFLAGLHLTPLVLFLYESEGYEEYHTEMLREWQKIQSFILKILWGLFENAHRSAGSYILFLNHLGKQ